MVNDLAHHLDCFNVVVATYTTSNSVRESSKWKSYSILGCFGSWNLCLSSNVLEVIMANPEHHRKITEPDQPDRCQALLNGTVGAGQCTNVQVKGSQYCLRHGGHHAAIDAKNEGLRNYRLTTWRARVNEFADNPQAKSLREEIGIMRLQLESIMNRCPTDTDLLMYSDRIGSLVSQIERLVVSCQKLEEKTGSLVDKTQLLTIADSIVKIIAGFIKEPEDLDIIGQQIIFVISKACVPEYESPISPSICG